MMEVTCNSKGCKAGKAVFIGELSITNPLPGRLVSRLYLSLEIFLFTTKIVKLHKTCLGDE